MKTQPNFKPIIRKVDEYEIHLRGDSTHYTAKTEQAAHEIANRIVKELWIECFGFMTRLGSSRSLCLT